MIIVVELGTGNIGSVLNMMKKIGIKATSSSNPRDILKANKIILPGVGAFDSAIKKLKQLDLIDILSHQVIKKKVPILGICLGMQLLCKCSEEGELPGLNYVNAKVLEFKNVDKNPKFKIPHMGWNKIILKKNNIVLSNLSEDSRFYFVHSYYVKCERNEDILATTNYFGEFVSAYQKENIVGVQFHPEKSHKFGMQILKNFAELL